MNKALTIAVVFAVCWCAAFSQGEPLRKQMKRQNSLEMGKRYLKLGFSWYTGGDFNAAEKYLDLGLQNIISSGNKYWEAVAYEYYGLLYYKLMDKERALLFLHKAEALYDRHGTISPPDDDGSNEAIHKLITMVEDDGQPGGPVIPGEKYQGLLNKYNKLVDDYEDLSELLKDLRKDIADLRRENNDLHRKIENLANATPAPSPIPDPETIKKPIQEPISRTTPEPTSGLGTCPWKSNAGDTGYGDESNNGGEKWLVLQSGFGNVGNFEAKIKMGKLELGGFLVSSNIYFISGAILSYEIYRGKNWDAPFDLTIGYATSNSFGSLGERVGPFIDGYAGFRYYFLDNWGVYAKAGYDITYVADLVSTSSYLHTSVGLIFRL